MEGGNESHSSFEEREIVHVAGEEVFIEDMAWYKLNDSVNVFGQVVEYAKANDMAAYYVGNTKDVLASQVKSSEVHLYTGTYKTLLQNSSWLTQAFWQRRVLKPKELHRLGAATAYRRSKRTINFQVESIFSL